MNALASALNGSGPGTAEAGDKHGWLLLAEHHVSPDWLSIKFTAAAAALLGARLAAADMYSIRVDIHRNRLYVTLVGFFSLDEIKKCGDETIEATKRLRRGYDVVTDITQFKAGTADVAADVERVQAHFRRSGARQGVRIVGSNVLSGMQFRRTGTSAEYNSVNVKSLEEAEKMLNDR